jgi:hypothetical protein
VFGRDPERTHAMQSPGPEYWLPGSVEILHADASGDLTGPASWPARKVRNPSRDRPLAREMSAWSHARTVARPSTSAEFEEPNHPSAVRAVGRQHLGKLLVIDVTAKQPTSLATW